MSENTEARIIDDTSVFLFWHVLYIVSLFFSFMYIPYFFFVLHCFWTIAILFKYDAYITNEYDSEYFVVSDLSFFTRMIVSLNVTYGWLQSGIEYNYYFAGIYLLCSITTNRAMYQKTLKTI